jgi:hypothetical protein
MLDEREIDQFLRAHDLRGSGYIARDGSDGIHFYVFIEVSRNSKNHQVPSNKKLDELREGLAVLGTRIEFILTDIKKQDIEKGVRASLLHTFGTLLRNSFLSTNGKKAHVWVEPKKDISEIEFAKIKEKTVVTLSLYGLVLETLRLTKDDKLPSKTACIKTLRGIAPANLERIASCLREQTFTVPSTEWLARVFDSLRKTGFVVRLTSGKYALSLVGLKALGTAKNARSPDLARLLDLARQGN